MKSYHVYFRTDIEWTRRDISAEDGNAALALARQFARDHFDQFDFDRYESCDCPINEIEVLDEQGNELAVWYDKDLRLQLAARDLLDAGQLVLDRWERGDLAEAVRQLDAAVAKAKGGAL